MNGISCTESYTCIAYENKCQNPHKDLLNLANGGDDDNDDKYGDCSDIWINYIILWQLRLLLFIVYYFIVHYILAATLITILSLV